LLIQKTTSEPIDPKDYCLHPMIHICESLGDYGSLIKPSIQYKIPLCQEAIITISVEKAPFQHNYR
jgi:hypothetical protein